MQYQNRTIACKRPLIYFLKTKIKNNYFAITRSGCGLQLIGFKFCVVLSDIKN